MAIIEMSKGLQLFQIKPITVCFGRLYLAQRKRFRQNAFWGEGIAPFERKFWGDGIAPFERKFVVTHLSVRNKAIAPVFPPRFPLKLYKLFFAREKLRSIFYGAAIGSDGPSGTSGTNALTAINSITSGHNV